MPDMELMEEYIALAALRPNTPTASKLFRQYCAATPEEALVWFKETREWWYSVLQIGDRPTHLNCTNIFPFMGHAE